VDSIGQFTFFRMDKPPERVSAQWQISARGGINGLGLWNSGTRGEPFTITAEAVAITYAAGRTFLANYKYLEQQGPVPLICGNQLESMQLYKVLKVTYHGPGVKAAIVRIGGDPNTYGALVYTAWTLIAIDPNVQQP